MCTLHLLHKMMFFSLYAFYGKHCRHIGIQCKLLYNIFVFIRNSFIYWFSSIIAKY